MCFFHALAHSLSASCGEITPEQLKKEAIEELADPDSQAWIYGDGIWACGYAAGLIDVCVGRLVTRCLVYGDA